MHPRMTLRRRQSLKTSLLGCSAIALGALATALPAQAQTAAASTGLEEIVVTGIRASLQRAMDVKREAETIVDAIASEDLGKFPDSNVAESLQRISGVSIDRSGGEGQFVTVRGFGPEFNTVLVNGRRIASENQGREFSFDLLAAELISGADVYKSSDASLQEGGIGSTINVKMARPLDLDGFQAVVSAKGVYESTSEKVAPQAFGFISNTFADDKIGVLLSVSHQERKAQIDSVETRGFNPNSNLTLAGLSGVTVPQNFDQIVDFQKRERTGVTAVVQYQAADNLLLTVDGLYNRFSVKSRASSMGHWFTADQILDAEVDENGTVVSLQHNNNGATDFISRTFNRPTKTRAAGFNAEWQPSDSIDVVFDAAWSRSNNNNGGNDSFAVIGFNNGVSYDNTGGGIPVIGGIPDNVQDPSIGRAHIAIREGWDTSDEIFEFRADSVWHADGKHLKRVRFGANYGDQTKDNQLIRTDPNTLCLYCGYQVDVPDSLLTPFNAGSSFLGGFGDVPRQWQTFDPDELFAFLESPEAAAAADAAFGRAPGTTAAQLGEAGFGAQVQPDSFRIQEKIFAAYVDVQFEGEVGGRPWQVVAGARYVHTNTTAIGTQLTLTDLRVVPSDETIFNGVFAGDSTTVQQTNTYDKLLPTFNAKVDITDRFIARFAASKSLTRPQLQDLAPRVNFDVLRPRNLLASGGNPNLKPFTSDNFDLSLEWYIDDASYLALGLFYKSIDNFIVATRANEAFPVQNVDGIDEFEPNDEAIFSVRRPRNAESSNVRGLEISGQYVFSQLPAPFDGLGINANATFVDSSAKLGADDTVAETFALEGLGNSQNVIAFYSKDAIDFRVAYNRRASFLQNISNGVGGDPIFVKTFAQVDIRGSYEIFEGYSVFFEGINVFNEKVQRHGREENQLLNVIDSGARWSLGVRAQF